jgi:hypothetical protein
MTQVAVPEALNSFFIFFLGEALEATKFCVL